MSKLSVFAFVAIAAVSVFGGSVAWVGGAADQPNAWGVGANWAGGELPGPDDTADFSGVSAATTIDLGGETRSAAAILPGAGALTFSGAEGASLTLSAASVSTTAAAGIVFAVPVSFTGDAELELRNGSLTFESSVAIAGTLKLKVKSTVVRQKGAVSGGVLAIIGVDALDSSADTTVLKVDNSAEEVSGRFSGLAELKTKGPVRLQFAGASGESNTQERLAKLTLGIWQTYLVLENKMTLTLGVANAEPGGFLSRSVAAGSYLKSEEPMVNGVWKPWTDLTGSGYFSALDADGNVINKTPTAWLPGSGADPAAVYRQAQSTVTLADDMEISGYRAEDKVTIALNGHDLTIGSGVFATGTQWRDIQVNDSVGGGRLVFGGNDIFMNLQNNYPKFSAPFAWRRPTGNTSVGPSLFIMGNHWDKFWFTGDDQIHDYNIIYVGSEGNTTVFGGSGDRTVHTAIIGSATIQKDGTGTLRIAGAHYPSNSGTINVNAGRLIFDTAASRYYNVNVNSGATLELGTNFNASITGLSLVSGSTLSGLGQLNLNIGSWQSWTLKTDVMLSPGLPDKIGEMKLGATNGDVKYHLSSGVKMHVRLTDETCDAVNWCGAWNHVYMPDNGTIYLSVSGFDKNVSVKANKEYCFFRQTETDSGGWRFFNADKVTWVVTTPMPNRLDVSNAKVVYRKQAYYLTGVKSKSGMSVIIR